MITIAKIRGITTNNVGKDVYAKLAAIYPDGAYKVDIPGAFPRFECDLPWDDDRLQRVLACLAEHNCVPFNSRRPGMPREYRMTLERVYDSHDLESARYLNPFPQISFRCYDRSPDGLVLLKTDRIRLDVDLAFTGSDSTVVSSRLKGLIEKAGMKHVVFRETQVVGDPELQDEYTGKFWELTSDFHLPPMSQRCKFMNALTGDEVTGDSDAPFAMREGLEVPEILYSPAEIRYDEAAIQPIGDFDLGLTHEKFVGEHSRMKIASQNFYRFCEAHGLDVEWVPVRIDCIPGHAPPPK